VITVAILDDYQHAALASADWSALAGLAEITAFTDHLSDPDALARRLAGFDVVVAMRERTPFPGELVRRLPRLRLLITTGRHNASFDLEATAAQGVTVCGTGGAGSPTPELAWGLVLALARNIPAEDAGVRRGHWQSAVGRGLAGSTIGILGLGRVGRKIATYARAFDMKCIAWSQHLTAAHASESGARLVTRQELFEQADVVSVHLQLSPRTRHLVGARELDWLGPDGLLVNTSRGPIVDEAALVDALRERRIAGAALDVFDTEPLPRDHPLRTLPNTVITPHIGYVVRETYAVFYRDVVEDIAAWLSGVPIRCLT
jgi:phosphoglycerate dehydrogenase-like enzyme